MKSNVILNDDKVIKERLKYCDHITLGRFLNIQRTVSPLSHEKVAGQTTINSSTTWNMEQVRNYSILSYAQVIYTHFIALKCKFYVLHLSKTMIKAIQNGQCIIIKTVDPDKLDDYLPGEILLEQHAEELERRRKAREALLSKSMHLRISKSQEQENEKKKKENEKKKRKEQEKKRKEKEKGDKGKKKSEKRVKLS